MMMPRWVRGRDRPEDVQRVLAWKTAASRLDLVLSKATGRLHEAGDRVDGHFPDGVSTSVSSPIAPGERCWLP
jgi:hypothetical protein